MGIFVVDAIKGIGGGGGTGVGGVKRTADENRQRLEAAGTFAEQQLSPYMLDPSVAQELNNIAMGRGDFRDNPLYRQYMDVGRESMLEDMAGTGTLYSGVRMEGMRDLGQSAFNNYMNMLTGLAGFGRQTAGQMGDIRMGTAGNVSNVMSQKAADVANIKMAEQANKANLMNAMISGGASLMTGLPMGGVASPQPSSWQGAGTGTAPAWTNQDTQNYNYIMGQ